MSLSLFKRKCNLNFNRVFALFSGNVNNCHCLALAVNQLAGALFSIHGPGDVHDRLQEFLAVSSISILQNNIFITS